MPNRDLHAEGVELLDRVRDALLPAITEAPDEVSPRDYLTLALTGIGYVNAGTGLHPPTHIDAAGSGWYRDLDGQYRPLDSVASGLDSLPYHRLLIEHGTFTAPTTAR